MNIRAFVPIDKAQFFAFAQTRTEGRYEFERGRIVQQMTSGTGRHFSIAQQFVSILERQLTRDTWIVGSHGRAVETTETVRQPDVIVERLPIDLDAVATTRPVLVVEVLSPSTRATDLNLKPPEYMSLDALHAYIAAEQDQAKCWVWLRDEAGAFPAAPIEVAGIGATITLPQLGVTLPLADIYRGLGYA